MLRDFVCYILVFEVLNCIPILRIEIPPLYFSRQLELGPWIQKLLNKQHNMLRWTLKKLYIADPAVFQCNQVYNKHHKKTLFEQRLVL